VADRLAAAEPAVRELLARAVEAELLATAVSTKFAIGQAACACVASTACLGLTITRWPVHAQDNLAARIGHLHHAAGRNRASIPFTTNGSGALGRSGLDLSASMFAPCLPGCPGTARQHAVSRPADWPRPGSMPDPSRRTRAVVSYERRVAESRRSAPEREYGPTKRPTPGCKPAESQHSVALREVSGRFALRGRRRPRPRTRACAASKLRSHAVRTALPRSFDQSWPPEAAHA
jgi:hypothetical protein